MLPLKRKLNIIFYQIFIIGLLFFSLLIFLSYSLFNRLFLMRPAFFNKLEVICGCTNHLSFFNHPYLFISLPIAGVALIIFFTFVIIKIVNIRRATKKFINSSLIRKKHTLSQKLRKAISQLNLDERVVEINDRGQTVFCYGFIKPKICVSSSFIKKLSIQELKAVLLHEQYHLITYEPIKLFVVKILTKILFFIPGVKLLTKQYSALSELAADEWAISRSMNRSQLAGVVYKVLKWNENVTNRSSLAVPFFTNITEERVNNIINKEHSFNVKIISSKLLINIFFILSLFLFLNLFINFSSGAITENRNDNCTMQEEGRGNRMQGEAACSIKDRGYDSMGQKYSNNCASKHMENDPCI